MRIRLYPSILKVVLVSVGLLTAGCSDLSQKIPLTFSGMQTAERETEQPERSKTARLPQIWMQVARQAIKNGHPDTAIRFAQRAAEAAPKAAEPIRLLAQAYRQKSGGDDVKVLAQDTPKPAEQTPAETPATVAESTSPPEQFEPIMAAIAEKLSVIAPTSGNSAIPTAKAASKSSPKADYQPRSAARATVPATNPAVPVTKPRAAKSHKAPTPQRTEKKQQIVSARQAIRRKVPNTAGSKPDKSPVYRIQLGAYFSLDDAVRGQKVMARQLPAGFPRLGVFVRRGSSAQGKRINYRLRSQDLATEVQAATLCKAVKETGASCLPIRQTSNVWQYVKTSPVPKAAKAATPRDQNEPVGQTADSGGKPAAIQVSASRASLPLAAENSGTAEPLYRIQLAAYRDLAWAVRGKDILSKNLPGNFPRLDILKRRGAGENETRINYRVRFQGLWQKDRALALCQEARSAGYGCLLLEPAGKIWRPVVAELSAPGKRLDRRT